MKNNSHLMLLKRVSQHFEYLSVVMIWLTELLVCSRLHRLGLHHWWQALVFADFLWILDISICLYWYQRNSHYDIFAILDILQMDENLRFQSNIQYLQLGQFLVLLFVFLKRFIITIIVKKTNCNNNSMKNKKRNETEYKKQNIIFRQNI